LWAFRQLPEGRFVDLGLPDEALGKLRAYGVRGEDGNLHVVLINIQDPAAEDATDDTVTLKLPHGFRGGRQTTLASSAAGGLSSLDASAITLGGASVTPAGTADRAPQSTRLPSDAPITVAPGTAQIITVRP
ncbi:hypothetical protein, partial [Streptomyces sp. NPDC059744]|uniref:hypothetical protein n=1 Tax=Streptomyces sp. NPDC059744 TaxID=3346929 RepID=UPI00366131D4